MHYTLNPKPPIIYTPTPESKHSARTRCADHVLWMKTRRVLILQAASERQKPASKVSVESMHICMKVEERVRDTQDIFDPHPSCALQKRRMIAPA